MKTNRSSSRLIGLGVLSAVAASLCCITPVLALIAGTAGLASTFSWLEPARPYLIGITVVLLGFAWYQKLKARKVDATCNCEEDKLSFWKSKAFLTIITVLVILIMTFPVYSKIFFPKQETKEVIVVDKSNIQQVKLNIKGMTCEACSQTINMALSKVSGVLEYHTQFKDGSSIVKFDHSRTSEKTIIEAVNATGYKVMDEKNVNF